jgi:hypothetical protein
MAQRGRTSGFKMPDSHRTKIANSKILNRLIDFAEGKEGVEMSPHQVTTALGLMRKVLPDLSAVEIEGDVTHNVIRRKAMTDDEWAAQHGAE